MSPQCEKVLAMLRSGPVTGVEAEAVYKVRHLPRRIKDLRDSGFSIVSNTRKDTSGQRYVRYTLSE